MIVPVVIGLAMVAFGLAAYSGRWPDPVLRARFPASLFGGLWGGIALALVAPCAWMLDRGGAWRAPGAVLALVCGVGFVIFLLSFVRMPRVLLPGWFRRLHDRTVDLGRSTR